MTTRITNADKENAVGVPAKGLRAVERPKSFVQPQQQQQPQPRRSHHTPLKAKSVNGNKPKFFDHKTHKPHHGVFDDSLEIGGGSLLFTSAKKQQPSDWDLHRGRRITVQKDSPFLSARKNVLPKSPAAVPKSDLVSRLAEVQNESSDEDALDLPSSKKLGEMPEIPDGYEPFDQDLLFKLYAPGQQVKLLEELSDEDDLGTLESRLKVQFDDMDFELEFPEEEEESVATTPAAAPQKTQRFMASTSSSRNRAKR